MQVSKFFNTLAFVILFSASAPAFAQLNQDSVFSIDLLSADLIEDNYADTLAFGKKPDHPEPIPCDCNGCNQNRVPGIIKGSTMRDIEGSIQDAVEFVRYLIK